MLSIFNSQYSNSNFQLSTFSSNIPNFKSEIIAPLLYASRTGIS